MKKVISKIKKVILFVLMWTIVSASKIYASDTSFYGAVNSSSKSVIKNGAHYTINEGSTNNTQAFLIVFIMVAFILFAIVLSILSYMHINGKLAEVDKKEKVEKVEEEEDVIRSIDDEGRIP